MDDGQYLLLALVILTVPCILKTFMEMLLPIALAMDPEIITLLNAGLEALEDLRPQECKAIKDPTPPGSPLQISSIAN